MELAAQLWSNALALEPALPPIVEARSIAKSYGATEALKQVDLSILPGEIHALLGGNGAGKSTLVKILLGAIQPSSGQLFFRQRPVVMRSVREAMAAGIYPIYQDLSQFPHLTVRENFGAFSLGTTSAFLARSAMPADASIRQWLGSVGLDCDLDTPVSSLSIGQKQLLEVARAIAQNAAVLIFDEPTAALTQAESDSLLAMIRTLRDSGVGILFISHKLDEVVEISDRVSVIRDGQCAIAGAAMAELTTKDLIRAMVGLDVAPIGEIARPGAETVLDVAGLRIEPGSAPIDFSVKAGEVVGLAGIVGCGSDRIAAAIVGAEMPASGRVTIDGQPLVRGDRAFAVGAGVGYVPPDRHSEGLFNVLTAVTNTSASLLRFVTKGGAIHRRKERANALEVLSRVALHPLELDREASQFSGGNQQKLVVARNLSIPQLKLLVMSEPTRGVDVSARRAIHKGILDAAAMGVAVVVASSDIEELIDISHRILIVQRQAITGGFERGAARPAIVDALAEATG